MFFLTYVLYLYSSTAISEPKFALTILNPRLCIVITLQFLLFFRRSSNSSTMLLLNAINRHFFVFGTNCIADTIVVDLPLPATAFMTPLPSP